MNENGEYTYSANPGQVTMPAPEHRQTVTVVEGVSRSGGYVNNEYASAPAAGGADLSTVLAERAAAERQALAEEAAQIKAQIGGGVPQNPQPQASAPQPAPAQNMAAAPAPQPAVPQAQPQPVYQTTAPAPQAAPQRPVPQPQPTVMRATPQPAGYSEYAPQAAAPQSAPQAGPEIPGASGSDKHPAPQSAPAANHTPAAGSSGSGSVPPSGGSKKKNDKKGPGFGVRLLMAAACGLVFGLLAGGVILLMTRVIPGGNTNNPSSQTVQTSQPVIVEIPSGEKTSTEHSGKDHSSATALIGDGQEESITVTEVTADMTVPEVAKECMPSIVIINTLVDYNYYGYVQEVPASGTGVIVGMNEDDLFIATNYHVVEGAKEITVQFCDSSTANAEVKGKKVSTDLAVVTVDLASLGQTTKDNIKLARIGSSDELVVGESCVAIGNALGYGQSVTTGVISALNREVTTETGETGTFIQTDAAINPGNSGGALINMRGEVIGINSNKRGGTTVEGMGYAIPIDIARPIIEQLIEKKELTELPAEEQSYFGISGATVQSGATTSNGVVIPSGIYVSSVVAGSPADKAGIQRGDIITEFDGSSVISIAELMQCLASYPSGVTVPVTYKRLENGTFVTHEAQVTLESKSGSTTR